MTNYLKVDDKNRTLIMDRTFAHNAAIVGSREYNLLQSARSAYPEYTVIRRTISKNTQKKTYKGLTYEYMEDYISTHESPENRTRVLDELLEMRLIAACHSKAFRYPTIKRWFLNRYPEIVNFGIEEPKVELHVVSDVA